MQIIRQCDRHGRPLSPRFLEAGHGASVAPVADPENDRAHCLQIERRCDAGWSRTSRTSPIGARWKRAAISRPASSRNCLCATSGRSFGPCDSTHARHAPRSDAAGLDREVGYRGVTRTCCKIGKPAPRGVVHSRRVSQLCRLRRVAGYGIIGEQRTSSAHLHRPWRATSGYAIDAKIGRFFD